MHGNPFDPYGPVTEMERFFGRREYIQEILSGIRTPRSYGVIGGRRIGKSSLLNCLAQKIRLENQSYSELTLIPVDISLHRATPRSRRAFFNILLRDSADRLNTHYNLRFSPRAFTLPDLSEDDFDLDVALELLLNLIQRAMSELGDIRIVFLIDEIEYLTGKAFADDLISNLRYTISNHPVRESLSFVMFGDRYLYEIANVKGSPLENVVVTLQLGAFNEQESLELINVPTGGKLDQGLAEKVILLSNCHPCIIQHLMYRLAELDLEQLREADIYNACTDLVQQNPIFRDWLRHFTNLEKQLYYTFAKHKGEDAVSLSIVELHSVFPAELLIDSLDRLFYHGLLYKPSGDTYAAILGSFAQWFRERFSEAEDPTSGLDLRTYNEYLARVKKRYSQKDSDDKGKALEKLARLLLESCEGISTRPRYLSASGEIDLLVVNRNCAHPCLCNVGDFICECKNWDIKVGVQHIQTFAYRMKRFGCSLGLYFSKLGITGDITKNAKKIIHDMYHDEKRYLIVLTIEDLNSIGEGRDFLEILEEKERDIRFEKI